MPMFDAYLNAYRQFQATHPYETAFIWVGIWFAIWLLLVLISRGLFTRIVDRLAGSKWLSNGIRFRSWTVVAQEDARKKLESIFGFVHKILKWMLFAGFILVALGLFPQTLGAVERLYTFLSERLVELGLSILDAVPNLIFVAIVALLTVQVIKLNKAFMIQVEEEKLEFQLFPPEYAAPTRQILNFFIIIFAMVVAAPYLPGSGSNAFQAITLFVGILVSLGSSTAIANMIASFVLQYMRAFKVGDTVSIGPHVGTVMQVQLFSTKLRTIANEEISIPNTLVLTGSMSNYSRSEHLAVTSAVSIGYDVPWKKVYQTLLNAARAMPEILDDPEPFVIQKSLDDFYVSYELYANTKEVSRLPHIKSVLNEHVRNAFDEAGIEILSPSYLAVQRVS